MAFHPRLAQHLENKIIRHASSARHPEQERLLKVVVIRGDFTRDGVPCRFDEFGSSDLTRERAVRCETSETQRVLPYGRSGLEAGRADGDTGREMLFRSGSATNHHFFFTLGTELTMLHNKKQKKTREMVH